MLPVLCAIDRSLVTAENANDYRAESAKDAEKTSHWLQRANRSPNMSNRALVNDGAALARPVNVG